VLPGWEIALYARGGRNFGIFGIPGIRPRMISPAAIPGIFVIWSTFAPPLHFNYLADRKTGRPIDTEAEVRLIFSDPLFLFSCPRR